MFEGSKVCVTCALQKLFSEFRPRRRQCNQCRNDLRRLRYAADEVYREEAKARTASQRGAVDYRERLKAYRQTGREDLRNDYVKRLLNQSGIRWNEITPELVQMKREALEVERLRRTVWSELQPYQEAQRKAKSPEGHADTGSAADKARERSRRAYWSNPQKARSKVASWKARNHEKLAQQRQRAKERLAVARNAPAAA